MAAGSFARLNSSNSNCCQSRLSSNRNWRQSFTALSHSRIVLRVRPGRGHARRQIILEEWYREQIKQAVPPLFAKWERLMGVKVKRFFVQRMKTKGGRCNVHARTVRLNTDLAKKPRECLEYIVVHELVHLIERHHNDRFRKHMYQLLPQWHRYRGELNSAPLAHEK